MYDHDTMTQRETELMTQVATLEKSLIEANHALLLERLGTHRAEELLAAAQATINAHEKRWHDACTHDYDISLLEKIDTEKAKMTPIVEALESLCHAIERGETDDDYLRTLAEDGRWAISPPKEEL